MTVLVSFSCLNFLLMSWSVFCKPIKIRYLKGKWRFKLKNNPTMKTNTCDQETTVAHNFSVPPFLTFIYTVNSPLTDTLVSDSSTYGHCFQFPFYLFPFFSRGNSSRKRTAPLMDTFSYSRGCPLTRELTVYNLTYFTYVRFLL